MQLHQHFGKDCMGTENIYLFDKNDKPLKDEDGLVYKHKSLCNIKFFIIDTVKPKTIYKFLIGAIDYKAVLSELYYLEMKYQGETLAFMHGLNTYVDWHATDGLRKTDLKKVRPDLNIGLNDYDNIHGLDQFLTREEFQQCVKLIQERLVDLKMIDS